MRPTFGKKVLMLSASDSLLVTLLVAISNFVWLPVGGALSDRFGRKPVLIAMTLLALATSYPGPDAAGERAQLLDDAERAAVALLPLRPL